MKCQSIAGLPPAFNSVVPICSPGWRDDSKSNMSCSRRQRKVPCQDPVTSSLERFPFSKTPRNFGANLRLFHIGKKLFHFVTNCAFVEVYFHKHCSHVTTVLDLELKLVAMLSKMSFFLCLTPNIWRNSEKCALAGYFNVFFKI